VSRSTVLVTNINDNKEEEAGQRRTRGNSSNQENQEGGEDVQLHVESILRICNLF